MRKSNFKMFVPFIFVLLAMIYGCNNRQNNKSDNLAYADKLIAMGYANVMNENALDSIWESKESRIVLKRIVYDTAISEEPKFIVSEILFNKDVNFPSESERTLLAPIYQKILQMDKYQFYFIMQKNKNSIHREKEHLFSLEKKIIPHLYLLLDNNSPYSDSILFRGNAPHAIKDIACSYICNILNFSYKHFSDSLQNCLFIDSVKQKIPESLKIN